MQSFLHVTGVRASLSGYPFVPRIEPAPSACLAPSGIKAEAQRVQYEVEVKGMEMRNTALNTLDAEQIAMQIKMKLLDAVLRETGMKGGDLNGLVESVRQYIAPGLKT